MLMFDEVIGKKVKPSSDLVRLLGKTSKPTQLSFDQLLGVVKYNPNQPRDNKGRWTAGAGGKGEVTPGLGSGPKGQRRYWLYDADYKLIGTYESLSAAKIRSLAHSAKTGEFTLLHDSVGQREAKTIAFEPGFNRPPQFATDRKGKIRWRDTSKDFADDSLEEPKVETGHSMFGDRKTRKFDANQPRDAHGQWTSDDGSAESAQRRVDELTTRLSGLSGKSEDIYWGTQRQLDLARQELGRRQAMEKAFNPDEARDSRGRWTAAEEALSTAKDVARIMDKARLDRAHNAISPETDRNDRRLSTSNLEEWTSGPVEEIQDLKDFKPGNEHHDSLTPEERDEHRQWLHEQIDGVHEEVQGHLDKLAAGLAAYSKDADAYAARVRDTLAMVNARMGRAAAMTKQDDTVEKDLTAGDVHAPTALGNEGKGKAKDFLTTIGEINGARIVSVPAAPVGKEGKRKPIPEDLSDEVDTGDLDEDTIREIEEMFGVHLVDKKDAPSGTKKVYIIRHGSTDLNNHGDDSQDRIRGWLDVPLNDDGRKDAQKAAKKAAKAGIKVLVTSDLKRAKETADIIGKEIGATPIVTPKLRPWDLGKFAGKPSKEVYPQILEYVESKPDEPVPDGESFNDFVARAMSGLKFTVDKCGDQVGAGVTHYRNGRLYASWDEAGQPADHSIDKDEFSKKGGPPGDLMELDVNVKRLAGNGSNVEKVDIGMDVFMRAINGDTEAIGELAQISKADGKVNATLMLQPLESDPNWARTPFPWDASVKASMRPDQVKPFLGALTDPQELPVKTVLLRTCVAMQDRVDPDKVQSMIDSEPDDLPVVARLGANGNDTRNVIIDGHHRMTARHLMGRKTAQVRFIDLTTPAKANAEAKEEEVGSTSDK